MEVRVEINDVGVEEAYERVLHDVFCSKHASTEPYVKHISDREEFIYKSIIRHTMNAILNINNRSK